MKFKTGPIVTTRGIAARMDESELFRAFVHAALFRHVNGDWGDICPEDEGLNDQALIDEDRLFSVYKEGNGDKIWIITEWDRSCTTVLFPDEY
jgi:hypothetical protein